MRGQAVSTDNIFSIGRLRRLRGQVRVGICDDGSFHQHLNSKCCGELLDDSYADEMGGLSLTSHGYKSRSDIVLYLSGSFARICSSDARIRCARSSAVYTSSGGWSVLRVLTRIFLRLKGGVE